jgi:polyhydroxyalkanoate synthase
LQRLQGFDPSQNEWIQAWLSRLSAEGQLLNFFEPTNVDEIGKILMSLSVNDPDRFREFATQLLPKIISALLDSKTDDPVWQQLLDDISSSFPEMAELDRTQILWMIKQVHSTEGLIDKLRSTFESGKINIEQGIENWRQDILAGAVLPDTIRPDSFSIGDNLASTPGDVVFENQLFQLIQYRSTTDSVHQNPILLVPAFVNRFYILDLSGEYSMVRWLVEKGHTVFLISWVNPTEMLAPYDTTHYVLDGALAALDQIDRMLPSVKTQIMGYCAGGVIASIMTAWLKARGDDRIASLSLITTLLDYDEPGPLGRFVSNESIESIRKPLTDVGYLPAEIMLRTFASLRPHDLLIGRILTAYVLGERSKPFPLIHWLGDGTRTPASLVLWFLENLYLNNALVSDQKIEIAGQTIDLSTIDCPVFLFGAERDDISPWKSVMTSAQIFPNPPVCILGEGGHNSGVISPPTKNRHNHYILDLKSMTDLSVAEKREGSWWTTWNQFLEETAGSWTDPPRPGGGLRPVIEDAPGRYVKQS